MRLYGPLLQHFLKTTKLDPCRTNYSLLESFKTLGFTPKSLLLFNTPQHINSITSQIQELRSNHDPSLQVITAALDSNLKSSVSELWIDEPIEISDFSTTKSQEAKGSRNWEIIKSTINIRFQSHHTARLNVSNATLFHNGAPHSLSFHDTQYPESGSNLSSLSITIPLSFSNSVSNHYSNLIPLSTRCGTSSYVITKAKNNLIKQLNGKSSPPDVLMKLLKDSKFDMGPVEIFAKISDSITSYTNIHAVVAGGGEWGSSSNILVLKDLDLGELQDGKRYALEFLILNPKHREGFEPNKPGIWFECVDKDQMEGTERIDVKEFKDVLILGSTDGVVVDGESYVSPCELVGFDIDE